MPRAHPLGSYCHRTTSDAWWHWQAMLMDTAWVRFARLSDEARQCLAPLSANLSAALDVGKHLVGF